MKGLVCINCNYDNPTFAHYCSKCGFLLPKLNPQQSKGLVLAELMEECNEAIHIIRKGKFGARFCRDCGEEL